MAWMDFISFLIYVIHRFHFFCVFTIVAFKDGFYLSTVGANGKKAAALIYGIGKKRLDTGARLYCITRPNTGRSPKLETMEELSKRFQPATLVQAEKIWKDQFEGLSFFVLCCSHNFAYVFAFITHV